MSETSHNKYAVVTGANKGIGLEIVRQLASNGITVVLTARDEKRGLEALDKLKTHHHISQNLIFHQLDVVDPSSIASLAHFIKTQFGKLDILVNNAGINSAIMPANYGEQLPAERMRSLRQTYELAEESLQINYYGAKGITEALIPLLQLSDSPRIINVSSAMGKLQSIRNEWALKILNDIESLTVDGVDEVLREFLKDFKDGSSESKGWPTFVSAYSLSKVALNAYTRIVAKNQPGILINCVCPGFVKTDMNSNTGNLTPEEGAACPVRLALLPNDGPSGQFFVRSEVSSF